jgi:hypothetical protein
MQAYETLREQADNVIADSALVIVVDETPPARLYQLDRHGWSLQEMPSFRGLRDLVARGADYLVLNQPVAPNDSLTALLAGAGIGMGPVYVYPLSDTD